MKPNLRATATGSRVMSGSSAEGSLSFQLEDDLGGAEGDGVPISERLRTLDTTAVDLDAVGGAEVAHGPRGARGPHLGVLARHVGVVDVHVGLARAPEHGAAGAEHARAAVDA